MLIVTGMSGAGRSTVGNALEDLGWYVVDNLPPQMLRPLVELVERAGRSLPRIAAVVDVRGRDFFSELAGHQSRRCAPASACACCSSTRPTRCSCAASSQVRRPHPLQGDGTLLDGIGAERARLAELRESSDIVIDTSDLNIHQLATHHHRDVRRGRPRRPPAHPDELRVQVRHCPPTPTSSPTRDSCRTRSGSPSSGTSPARTPRCAEFVLAQHGARRVHRRLRRGARRRCWPATSARTSDTRRSPIGCTGGKHRSVAIAESSPNVLRSQPGVAVSVKHRDLGRE